MARNPHHAFPPIPAIPPDLVEPITVLARLASTFHRGVEAALANDPRALPDDVKTTLAISDSVLRQWLDHLGIDDK
jgi:hypothetical protein